MIHALEKYGLAMPQPTSEIWEFLLQHAQRERGHTAISAYALTASLGMESLAVKLSTHTLGVSLTDSITEADALVMGPVYLRRLFFLHLGRKDALKRVITLPPIAHRVLQGCSLEDQEAVVRAWGVAVAGLLLQNTPQNTSKEELENSLGIVVRRRRSCAACYDAVKDRVAEAVAQWLAVKSTI